MAVLLLRLGMYVWKTFTILAVCFLNIVISVTVFSWPTRFGAWGRKSQ